MAVSHKMTYSHTDGSAVLNYADTQTAGQELNISETISGSASDTSVAFELDISQCKMIYMKADQSLTVKTNNSTTPINIVRLGSAITTTEGVYAWSKGVAVSNTGAESAQSCGFDADITVLYVDNNTATDSLLIIKSLTDPTV